MSAMFDPLIFTAALASGLGLGGVYFHLLQRSVERLLAFDNPMRRLLTGTALRLAAALGVLFIAAQIGLEALAGTLLGFVLARTLILWRFRRRPAQ